MRLGTPRAWMSVVATLGFVGVFTSPLAHALTVYENKPYATNETGPAYGFVNIGPNPDPNNNTEVFAQLFDTAGFDTINTFSVDLHPYGIPSGPTPADVQWAIYDVMSYTGIAATFATPPLASGTFSPSALNTVSVYTVNNLNLPTAGLTTGGLAVVLTLPDQGLRGETGWMWEGSETDTDVVGLGAAFWNTTNQSMEWKPYDALLDLALYVDGIPSPTTGGPAVPEPGTITLFAAGAMALCTGAWRRRS